MDGAQPVDQHRFAAPDKMDRRHRLAMGLCLAGANPHGACVGARRAGRVARWRRALYELASAREPDRGDDPRQ